MKIFLFFTFTVIALISCEKNKESGPSSTPNCSDYAPPPFSGTIFIDPDIITSDDPTTFVSLSYNGQAQRTMYDRRVADWITISPYLFPAVFDDNTTIEIQVIQSLERLKMPGYRQRSLLQLLAG